MYYSPALFLRKIGCLSIGIVLVTSWACITSDSKNLEEMISDYPALRAMGCRAGEGMVELKFWLQDNFVGSYDIEWVSRPEQWKSVVFDSVGLSLLSVLYRRPTRWESKGRLKDLVRLKLEDGKRVLVRNEFSGLLVQEIPCLFQAKIPITWLDGSRLVNVQNSPAEVEFVHEDSYRQITIKLDPRQSDAFCVELRVKKFLGLYSYGPDYCVNRSEKNLTTALEWDVIKLELTHQQETEQ